MTTYPRQGIPLRPDPHARDAADRRSLIRAYTAKALATGPGQDARAVLRAAWPDDSTAAMVLRAAVSPIDSGDFPAITSATVLPALAPASASARLFARCMTVDLSGIYAVRVPYVSGAAQPGFVEEAAPAPATELIFSGVDVGPTRKILILAAVTGELENATPETASTIIGRALADATAKSIDTKLFSADAATTAAPAGLLDGLVALTPATGGTDTEMIGADIAALATAIGAADINPDDMVIVASSAQAAKLRLLASPSFSNLIIGSNVIADSTVIGIAPGAVAVGYSGAPEIESSKEALVHFEDATPLQIGVAGSPNTVAAPTKSAFQSDLIILRVRARCAWAAVPGAVQFLDAVEW